MKRFSEYFREHTMKTINSKEEIISNRGAEIMKMRKYVLFVRKTRK